MKNKEEDMTEDHKANGWIPDSDNPDNEYLRDLLSRNRDKKATEKDNVSKKKSEEIGD